MSRLKKRYNEEVKKTLTEKWGYKNPMLIPSVKKVNIAMGIAAVTKDKNAIQDCVNELAQISGQKPVVTKTRKAVAGFKIREEAPVGVKVTLRGVRMYDFIDRFVNIVCPRIPDFRGFNIKGDGQGNFTIGIDDQQIFPEINLDAVKRQQGMHITFVTSAKTDEECVELLRQLGMPFKDMPVIVAPAA